MPIAEDPEPRPSEEPKDGTDGKDPFADLVLDEEFVRGAAVKEQTGRTRMLAARWQHTPPVDPGGRRSVNDGPGPRKRFARRARPVDPWGNPPPRRGGWWRTPLFVVLTVALVLAALNVDGLRSWYSTRFGDGSGGTTAGTPVATVAPEAGAPTAAPPPVDPRQPTVDRPWAGSPAEGWPTGVDAFGPEPGTVTRIGVFDADQVAAQVELVKRYLAAANLDPRTVAGGRPEAALAMLGPEGRAKAEKALAAPSRDQDPTGWFSRFDGRDAIPVGDTYRLQGRISVEGDGKRGVLVHTDFTFVYPLRPGPDAAKRATAPKPSAPARPTGSPAPGGGGVAKPVGLLTPAADVAGDTWTARTVVRRVDTFRFYDPAKFDVERDRLYFERTMTDAGNTECDVYDGWYHPQFDQFAAVGGASPAPSGPTSDPYDRSQELRTDGVCGTVTRS
ncbi:hypothetical protein [Kitasatospora purpeofusca]|uniref:SCO2583/SCO2584 N-terminal domain-containing protein n=1 Tax=Kitasatospora purpeofusca TaxID=67352 RepID=UPI00386816C5|nr:hypothetical protein OIP63_16785 [Kitasatospora purpeofusca]